MSAKRTGPLWLASCGFSLIEIVFVLAIFAVLAAIALPNWSTLLPDFNLRAAARQVQSELHRIKSQAVSENVTYQLVFSGTGDNYRVERVGATPPQQGIKSLPEGIDVRNSTTLGFTARGTGITTPDGTLKLCNSKNAGYNIVVNRTGRIRICAPSVCNGDC